MSLLPPTVNALNDHQRLRLMRSSRKLGRILGTTPYLVESSSEDEFEEPLPTPKQVFPPPALAAANNRPSSRASRREGRIFARAPSSLSHTSSSSWQSIHSDDLYSSSSAQSSVTSLHDTLYTSIPQHSSTKSPLIVKVSLPGLKTTEPKISSKQANPLKLRLDPVPLSPSDKRYQILSPNLPTPVSPKNMVFANSKTSTIAQRPAERRRKMAKVCRTLGENVPPELVFPPPKSRSDKYDDDDDSLLTPIRNESPFYPLRRSPIPSFDPPSCVYPVFRSADLLSAGTASVLHRGPFPFTRQSTVAFQNITSRCTPLDTSNLMDTTSSPQSIGEYEGVWNVQDMMQVQSALRALRA